MRAAPEHGAQGADKFALFVEDHDTVGAGAVFVHRVMHIDVPLRILHNTVGVPVLDVGRELAPIVDALILVLAFADDRVLGPGFVRRPFTKGATALTAPAARNVRRVVVMSGTPYRNRIWARQEAIPGAFANQNISVP